MSRRRQRKFPAAFWMGNLFWPVANTLNFRFLGPQHRVAYVAGCGVRLDATCHMPNAIFHLARIHSFPVVLVELIFNNLFIHTAARVVYFLQVLWNTYISWMNKRKEQQMQLELEQVQLDSELRLHSATDKKK